MKNAINSGIKELFGIQLCLSIALSLCAAGIAISEILIFTFPTTLPLPSLFHVDLVCRALKSDVVISFLPIISAIPFSGSYVDEIKSKYIRFICVRTGNTQYIASRVIVCYVGGAFVVALTVFLLAGLSYCVFSPLEEALVLSSDAVRLLVNSAVLLVLEGGFWAVVGLSVSTFMESKYISYATPFVLYYLLVILYERYFSDLFIIYPKTWADPTAWPYGCWGAAIFLLEMTLIFAILFAFRAGRRLQQL